jgi:Tfp pilus assembly protein PilO
MNNLARRVFTERRGVVLPLLVFLIVNIALLALAVVPLRTAVASAEEDAQTARNELNLAKGEDKRAHDARARKEQADVELKKFYAEILPHSLPGARGLITSWAKKTADASNLRYNSGEFQQKEERDSRLVRVSGKVILSGDYANIRRFLYALETAPEFVIVDNVALQQSGIGLTGAGQRANSAINLELSVATYYLGGER